MRIAIFLAACAACGGSAGAPKTPSDACLLAEAHEMCPTCYSGEVTCTYGDVSASAGSCGDCQARSALYTQLCAAGIADTKTAIEAGITCTDPVPHE